MANSNELQEITCSESEKKEILIPAESFTRKMTNRERIPTMVEGDGRQIQNEFKLNLKIKFFN